MGELQKFVEGSIKRVKLENFVTYDSVEFTPGPHLNVIIGPNGTGKSSIVCAMCLGLAGKTNMLGRAGQSSEFIKHGCAKATIEIELYNPDGDNYVIKREINRNNTSNWSVNGRPASLKVVEERVALLNIQIGNLTQFLPQDKVADFAKMSPQELLENTEKAVGSPEMYENHCRLKQAREDERRLQQASTSCNQQLEQEIQRNARLEVDVKNYQERQRHLRVVKVLQMKRPWVEYEEQRKQYQVEKERKEALQEQVREAQAANKPLLNALKEAKNKVSQVESIMKRTNDVIKERANAAAKKSKEIEEQTDKLIEVQDELKMKKTEEANRQKKVNDLKNAAESLQAELDALVQNEDVQPLLDKCVKDISDTNREMTKIQHQGQAIKREVDSIQVEIKDFQRQLTRLQDVSNQRFESLRTLHRSTYDATLWLRENKNLFQKAVFEPIMLLINVKDSRYAKYVEQHIPFNEMRMFLFEDEDEANLFLREVRDKQGLSVNAGKLIADPLSKYTPRQPIAKYKKYGFHSYLNELFKCPDPIMVYLCRMLSMHCVPVGNKQTKNNISKIMQEHQELSLFYTEDHTYRVKKSKYSGEVSSRCQQIRKPNLLKESISTEKEEEIKRQLKEKQEVLTNKSQQYRELQQSLKTLEIKMNKLRDQRKHLGEQKGKRKTLQEKIKTKKLRIQQLEQDAVNMEREEAQAQDKINNINNKKCKLLQDLKDFTKECMDLSTEKVRLCLRQASALREQQKMDQELKDKSTKLQNLERDYEDLKERCKTTKDQARKLLDVAKKATDTQPHEELSEQLRKNFEQYPSTLEGIDARIHEEQARADCVYQIDETIVQEYKQRQRDIGRLQQEKNHRQTELETHQAEIEEIKEAWLNPLTQLIERISINFSQFFRCLKCAGEVSLSVPENQEDYEKYGISIKVKYRDNAQLQELTPHHQSGGERSVATVCFMMALQELSKCPFRCVDEINQGMDPINERKIFELVVQTACREGTSQYFLLTPKLLPDLDYSERMTVLCIFNGTSIPTHTEWNMEKFIRRRNRMK